MVSTAAACPEAPGVDNTERPLPQTAQLSHKRGSQLGQNVLHSAKVGCSIILHTMPAGDRAAAGQQTRAAAVATALLAGFDPHFNTHGQDLPEIRNWTWHTPGGDIARS